MTLIQNKKFLPFLQKTQSMGWVILINVVPVLNIVPDFMVNKKKKRILVHTNVEKNCETKGPYLPRPKNISIINHNKIFFFKFMIFSILLYIY